MDKLFDYLLRFGRKKNAGEKPKKIWFRSRGLSFVPCAWQGWVFFFIYLAMVIFAAVNANYNSHSVSDTLVSTAFRFLALTAIFYFICWQHKE